LRASWTREDARLELLLSGVYQVIDIAALYPSTEHVPIWDLAPKILGYMNHAGKAVALLEHIVEVKECTLEETRTDWLALQHALAGANQDNEQKKQTGELLKHVVEMKETTLAETHPSSLVS
jgi:hypothetical protein